VKKKGTARMLFRCYARNDSIGLNHKQERFAILVVLTQLRAPRDAVR
jgi:hypothetical protein